MTDNNTSPGLVPEETSRYPERVCSDIQSNHGIIQTKSLPEVMADEVGHYIVCQMLVGTNKIVVFEGILTQVGNNYFVLFDEAKRTKGKRKKHRKRATNISRKVKKPAA